MRTIGDKLIVKLDEVKSSKIIIPDTSKKVGSRGVVVAIGGDVSGVKIDDKIIFGQYAGVQIKTDGEDYYIIREDDVLAII